MIWVMPFEEEIGLTLKEKMEQELTEEWIELITMAVEAKVTKEEFKKWLEEKHQTCN